MNSRPSRPSRPSVFSAQESFSAQKSLETFRPSLNSMCMDLLNNRKVLNAQRKLQHTERLRKLNKMLRTLEYSSKKAPGAPIKPEGRVRLSQEDIEELLLFWHNSTREFQETLDAPIKPEGRVHLSHEDIEELLLFWHNSTREFQETPDAPIKPEGRVHLSHEDIEELLLFWHNSTREFQETPQKDIEELQRALSNEHELNTNTPRKRKFVWA